jgi:serine/threonine protein kinase
MALDLDNFSCDQPSTSGFEFEREVREYLKNNISNDYVFRGGVLLWDGGYGKEMDFLLVGPKGVIIIEVKKIDGMVIGSLEDENWICRAAGMEDRPIVRPINTMNNKLHAVTNRFNYKGDFYHPFKEPLGVFVFSDNAIVDPRIMECNTSLRYRATHLKTLASVVDKWQPYRRDKSTGQLDLQQAKKIVSWIRKTNIAPSHEYIGTYKILNIDPTKYLVVGNDLEYSIGILEEKELGTKLRGKKYSLPVDKAFDLNKLAHLFHRHAAVIREIDHPNVHRYYAFIRSTSGRDFWVVEKDVAGETLDKIMTDGDLLPLNTARGIMRNVAEGLLAVHERNIVHRELTPQSIIVERDTKRAIVTNFELAKLLAKDAVTVANDRLPRNPYRALEVEIEPHNVDGTADVYSWGAILYHLLTGEHYAGIFPNIERFPKECHNDLSIAQMCLALQKDDRPQNFREILSLLD